MAPFCRMAIKCYIPQGKFDGKRIRNHLERNDFRTLANKWSLFFNGHLETISHLVRETRKFPGKSHGKTPPRLHSTRSWPMANGQVAGPQRPEAVQAVFSVQKMDFTLKQRAHLCCVICGLWEFLVLFFETSTDLDLDYLIANFETLSLLSSQPSCSLQFWYVFACRFHDYHVKWSS